MLLILLRLLIAQSEWIGNVTLYPSNKIFHNLKLLNRNLFKPINSNFSLCKNSDCTNKACIYPYSETVLSDINQSSQIIAIILADSMPKINSKIPIFIIPAETSLDLESRQSDSINISYNYDCNS